jgi:transposase
MLNHMLSTLHHCTLNPITMRRHILADIKRLVLRLATVHGYKYKKIHEILGVSERTTKHICARHRQIGDVGKKRTIDGGPCLLNGFHISVHQLFLLHSLVTSNAVDSFLRVVSNDSPT